MSDDHYAKSHALDSAPAYFLVLVRLFLLAMFLFGAVKTFEAEQSSVRRGFIGRLVALGTLWFAAMPLLVLVAMVCAEYIQEPVSGGGGGGVVALAMKSCDFILFFFLLANWITNVLLFL